MITLSQLQESCPCFQVHDTIYWGAQKSRKKDQRKEERFWRSVADQQWFCALEPNVLDGIPKKREWDFVISMRVKDVLERAYVEARHKNTVPEWLWRIPSKARNAMDAKYVIDTDVYTIIPHTLYAGFGFAIMSDGLAEFVSQKLQLHRLSNIRQLAFLTSPTITNSPMKVYPLAFTHNRYLHSLEVYAIATLIGYRLGLHAAEMLLLQIAALSHDKLTPAGGDVLKVIDPEAFDEDACYPEIFKQEGWRHVRDGFEVDEGKLAQVILGKGLLGSILDLADKLAYTARDTWEFLQHNKPQGFVGALFPEYKDILHILRANPYPCALWECVERKDDQLVFTDEQRLVHFIRLRALMFKILYANANARFVETGFVAALAKILYSDGTLTRQALLSMDDWQLFEVMSTAVGDNALFCPFHIVLNTNARVDKFASNEAAMAYERRIATESPATMTWAEKAPPPPTKCLDTFKVVRGQNVVSFSQANPEQSRSIAGISCDPLPYWVYTYDLERICKKEEMRARLLAARNQRIANAT